MWWDIIKSDGQLPMDFKIKKPWFLRFRLWALKKISPLLGMSPEILMAANYEPKTGNMNVFLDDLEAYRDRFPAISYKDLITELFTHEYIHKLLSEDPEINKLLEPYRKHRFDPLAVSAQEWATNQMATTDELRALDYLIAHPVVADSTKIKASKKIDMIYDKLAQVEDEVETFLQENPVEEQ